MRRRRLRLRQRRLARHLPRQRHDARGLPGRPGADQPSLSQPRRRHLRGRDRESRRRRQRLGPGRCAGDYDNDGDERPVRHLLRAEPAVPQQRRRHVRPTSPTRAGLTRTATRWGTGCAFLDYDRDGKLDLFVANYIDLDLRDGADARVGPVPLQGHAGRVRPAGTDRRQEHCSTTTTATARSTDVSERAGILKASGTYGLGVSTLDFDDDGWTDIYVANDSNPSALYRNNHDGTFTDVGVARRLRLQPGRQAAGRHGRGASATTIATAPSTSSRPTSPATRRRSTPTSGDGFCEDRTFASGLGLNTRWLGWGAGFVDFDNDGWLDIFLANGHVYPEVDQLKTEAGYEQRKVVYRNLGDRPLRRRHRAARAAGHDADGRPRRGLRRSRQRRRRRHRRQQRPRPPRPLPDSTAGPSNHWLTLRLVGTTSNRSAIGARVRVVAGDVTQVDEVRGGGSYFSQNDLRVHFGLGDYAGAVRVEVRWPNGSEETVGRRRDEPDRDADGGRRAARRAAVGPRLACPPGDHPPATIAHFTVLKECTMRRSAAGRRPCVHDGRLPPSALAQVDQERAVAYFKEARAVCERDGGRLWGVSICAPMVIGDARTQTFATSQPPPDAPRPRSSAC